MGHRRIQVGILAAVSSAAVLPSAATSAAAAVPEFGGPFPVTQSLLDEFEARIEQACAVEVVSISGTGSTRYIQFVDRDGEYVRGQETHHYTFQALLDDGSVHTVRIRVVDRYDYVDGSWVLRSSSGIDPVFSWIGLQRTDGTSSGRSITICP